MSTPRSVQEQLAARPRGTRLSTLRYLTFEVNKTCNLASVHRRCPVSDPERFMFGETDYVLTDSLILAFWQFCVKEGFRGVVLWHLYNEPTAELARIRRLLTAMRGEVPSQRTHLWTNSPGAVGLPEFDHVQLTDYRVVRPEELDNRRASTRGEGAAYDKVAKSGSCGRGFGWEIIVDFHANWLLCCNDWRCEQAIGNLVGSVWDLLLEKYEREAQIKWDSRKSYEALPRMCRSCIEVNPNLHRSALPPKGVVL